MIALALPYLDTAEATRFISTLAHKSYFKGVHHLATIIKPATETGKTAFRDLLSMIKDLQHAVLTMGDKTFVIASGGYAPKAGSIRIACVIVFIEDQEAIQALCDDISTAMGKQDVNFSYAEVDSKYLDGVEELSVLEYENGAILAPQKAIKRKQPVKLAS